MSMFCGDILLFYASHPHFNSGNNSNNFRWLNSPHVCGCSVNYV